MDHEEHRIEHGSTGSTDGTEGMAEPSGGVGPSADLECQALIDEQIRELAHRMRSPLGAIDLVFESLVQEHPGTVLAERLQVAMRASAKLKQSLDEAVTAFAPSRRSSTARADLSAACRCVVDETGVAAEFPDQGSLWINATDEDCALALMQALGLSRGTCGGGRTRMQVRHDGREVELCFTATTPGDVEGRIDEAPAEGLRFLRWRWLQRFATGCGGVLEGGPARFVIRLPILSGSSEFRA
jgi:hypothetical protein